MRFEITDTHMPFVSQIDGADIMVFCARDMDRSWKAHWTPLDIWQPTQINLKTPTRMDECSPAFYISADGEIVFSAIVNYTLIRYRGRSLDTITRDKPLPEYADLAGVVSPTHIVRADFKTIDICDHQLNLLKRVDILAGRPVGPNITRVTFLAEDPDKIIITAIKNLAPVSILYSISTGRRWEILAAGKPIYKCAFYKGELIYAERSGLALEDRRLVRTKNYTLEPLEPML